MPSLRLLPYLVADGPRNMAADECLLESAAAGTASLRFYGWSPPTLSLGYFQPERLRHSDPNVAQLPFVRRPSGGDSLVHHHEVTYALALPAGAPWHAKEAWPFRMHAIIVSALAELGVKARMFEPSPEFPAFAGVLCFHHWTVGDIIVESGKVVGSAQRRQRGAVMQHGGILLSQSPHTPSLPGIRELCGRDLGRAEVQSAVEESFKRATGWDLVPGKWTVEEEKRREELDAEKYRTQEWNYKR